MKKREDETLTLDMVRKALSRVRQACLDNRVDCGDWAEMLYGSIAAKHNERLREILLIAFDYTGSDIRDGIKRIDRILDMCDSPDHVFMGRMVKDPEGGRAGIVACHFRALAEIRRAADPYYNGLSD